MSTDQVVHLLIGCLSVVTLLMMALIVMISRLEVKNSKRHLNMKLMVYYNVKFHNMLKLLERYEIKEHLSVDDLYEKYQDRFAYKIKHIRDEISEHCVDNRFVFVSDELARDLKEKSNDLVATFQEWVDTIRLLDQAFEIKSEPALENDYVEELWHSYFLKYDRMKRLTIDMKSIINNDGMLEVII